MIPTKVTQITEYATQYIYDKTKMLNTIGATSHISMKDSEQLFQAAKRTLRYGYH